MKMEKQPTVIHSSRAFAHLALATGTGRYR